MAEPSVKSARRAMELLEFFAESRRPASVNEVSQSGRGWPAIEHLGAVRVPGGRAGFHDHDARTGMYSPSVRILLAAESIGEQVAQRAQPAGPADGEGPRAAGHTVMVGAQHGLHVRYLHVLQATRQGRFAAKTGRCGRCSTARPGRCC